MNRSERDANRWLREYLGDTNNPADSWDVPEMALELELTDDEGGYDPRNHRGAAA